MSRLPISPIQPVASPVNTFVQPSVTGSDQGSDLLQLAHALGQVQPQIANILGQRFDAQTQAAQARASADAAKLQLKNRSDLKSAVDQGLIQEQDNPWYMVQLKQEVARREARDAKEAAWVSYQNDPVQFSDPPGDVEAFLDKQLSPLIEGRDAWEMQAIMPELQQIKQSITNYHIQARSEQRVEERESAFKDDVRSKIDDLLQAYPDLFSKAAAGDPESTGIIQNLRAGIQQRLNEAGATVDWPKLNQWLVEAVGDSALDSGDRNLAKQVLGGITTRDGASISRTSLAKDALSRIDKRLTDEQIRNLQVNQELDKVEQDKKFNGIFGTAYQKYLTLKQTNPQASFWDVGIPAEELAKLDPDYLTKFIRTAETLESASDAQDSKARLTQLKALWSDGYNAYTKALAKNPSASLSTFFTPDQLAKLDPDTFTKVTALVQQETSSRRIQQEVQDHEASKQLLGKLYNKITSGSFDPKGKEEASIFQAFALMGDPSQVRLALETWQTITEGRWGVSDPQTEIALWQKQMDGSIVPADVMSAISDKKLSQHDAEKFMAVVSSNKREIGTLLGPGGFQIELQKMQQLVEARMLATGEIDSLHPENIMAHPEVAQRVLAAQSDLMEQLQSLSDSPEFQNLSLAEKKAKIDEATLKVQRKWSSQDWSNFSNSLPKPPQNVQPKSPSSQLPDKTVSPLTRFDETIGSVTDDQVSLLQEVVKTPTKVQTTETNQPLYQPSVNDITSKDPTTQLLTSYLSEPLDEKGNPLPEKAGEQRILRNKVLQSALNIKANLEHGDLAKFQELSQKFSGLKQNGKLGELDWKDKITYMRLASEIQQYAFARYVGGYTPAEVKAAGDDAWKSLSMFASEADLQQHGGAVADSLGISTDLKDRAEFIAAQTDLIRYRRTNTLGLSSKVSRQPLPEALKAPPLDLSQDFVR